MADFGEGLTPAKVSLDRGIGSEFWLPSSYSAEAPVDQVKAFLPKGKILFVTSGREAIYHIIKSIKISKDEKILLPSYLCQSILDPLVQTATKFEFYKVRENLELVFDDINEKVNDKTKAILIIHFFGFPQPMKDVKKLRKKLLIIEDTTHSFMTQTDGVPSGSVGDFSFASFRKMLPMPDGALICVSDNSISFPELPEQDAEHLNYKEKNDLGLYHRGLFIRSGNKNHKELSQKNFKLAEESLQTNYLKPCKMSEKSKVLLEHLKLKEIINQRRKNFNYLLQQDFKEIRPLFNVLPNGVCPLGFPILSENRNKLEKYLIKNKIYPPVHWRLPKCIDKTEFKQSWNISEEILTIPIDQRYDLTHMEYIKKKLKKIR